MEHITPWLVGQHLDKHSPLARTPQVSIIRLLEEVAELAMVAKVPTDSIISAVAGILQREMYRQTLGKPSALALGQKSAIEAELAEVSLLVKDIAYLVDAHLPVLECDAWKRLLVTKPP